jgi:hypothetical protein
MGILFDDDPRPRPSPRHSARRLAFHSELAAERQSLKRRLRRANIERADPAVERLFLDLQRRPHNARVIFEKLMRYLITLQSTE